MRLSTIIYALTLCLLPFGSVASAQSFLYTLKLGGGIEIEGNIIMEDNLALLLVDDRDVRHQINKRNVVWIRFGGLDITARFLSPQQMHLRPPDMPTISAAATQFDPETGLPIVATVSQQQPIMYDPLTGEEIVRDAVERPSRLTTGESDSDVSLAKTVLVLLIGIMGALMIM